MDQAQLDSNRYGTNGSAASLVVEHRALAALKKHPQYQIAASYCWCVPKVKLIPTHFVDRLRWDEQEKTTAKALLKGCDHFILVSCFTAATPHEARSGGTIYDFALNPKTFEVFHTSTSFWIC